MTETDPLRPEDFEPHRTAGSAGRAGFSDMWREQPLIRLGLILVPVIAVVALVIGTMGSSKPADNPSIVHSGSDIKSLPGAPDAPPAYIEQVHKRNDQEMQAAQENGHSSIPTPTPGQPVNTQNQTPVDPLQPFETKPVFNTTASQAVPPQAGQVMNPQGQPVAPPPIDQSLAQAMHQEMQSLMSSVVPKAGVITRITKDDYLTAMNEQAQAQQVSASSQPKEGPVIVPAGTVLYGQSLVEANSDLSSPVLVSILSGPFAGGRAIGTFQKPSHCDCIVLAFGTVIKDTKEYKVSAVAVDPETTSTALETSIDHHYFDRFILPAAAGFLQGIGQAAQQSGTTTTTSAFGTSSTFPPDTANRQLLYGLGTGAQAISNALNQDANRPITIHVAGGTPIGIMFTASVHEALEQ